MKKIISWNQQCSEWVGKRDESGTLVFKPQRSFLTETYDDGTVTSRIVYPDKDFLLRDLYYMKQSEIVRRYLESLT